MSSKPSRAVSDALVYFGNEAQDIAKGVYRALGLVIGDPYAIRLAEAIWEAEDFRNTVKTEQPDDVEAKQYTEGYMHGLRTAAGLYGMPEGKGYVDPNVIAQRLAAHPVDVVTTD